MSTFLESNIKNFLYSSSAVKGVQLLQFLQTTKYFYTATMIGNFLSNLYPHNSKIKEEIARAHQSTKNYRKSYKLHSDNLQSPGLTVQEVTHIVNQQKLLIPHISNDYTWYNPTIIKNIENQQPKVLPLVTFTITTCKRLDLFEKTINSFLNCCLDLNKIDHWLCVDDNSSEDDKKRMQLLYPFFTFRWKSLTEKGHPQSMNIIRDTVKTEYVFHVEDDWQFFNPRSYISECMDVLDSNPAVKQCLINKNYAETFDDIDIVGGLMKITKQGVRYFIHEYTPDTQSKTNFVIKYGPNNKNCAYWPHYSFRPSLLKREMWELLGPFNEQISHFEMDYSSRYVKHNFISAFLDSIYSIHIGRLTSQRDNKNIPNAYELNDEKQFQDKEEKIDKSNQPLSKLDIENLVNNFRFIPHRDQMGNDSYMYKENIVKSMQKCLSDKNCAGFNTLGFFKHTIDNLEESPYFKDEDGIFIKNTQNTRNTTTTLTSKTNMPFETYVINLDRRPDRLTTFDKNCPPELAYKKFSALDGKLMKPNKHLQKIFENNDFNMRSGLVGVAMSHIKLWTNLIKSDANLFLILEDDVTFIHDFNHKLTNLLQSLETVDWDLIYLGHHLYPKYQQDGCFDVTKPPYVEKWNSTLSLLKSMGGMFSYLISKNGARKLLDFINTTGMTNGIDTMQQKAIGVMDTFYCFPHLVYSKCVLPNNKVDSDIQYEHTSLSLPLPISQLSSHDERLKKNGEWSINDAIVFV